MACSERHPAEAGAVSLTLPSPSSPADHGSKVRPNTEISGEAPFWPRLVRCISSLGGSRALLLTDVSVGTREYHDVAIWVTQPTLAVLSTSIHVWFLDDLCSQLPRARYSSIELGRLEPQENPISVGGGLRVSQIGMLMSVPMVKLENQLPIFDEPLVLGATMPAVSAEELLVPTARRFDVPNCDQWLRAHPRPSHSGLPNTAFSCERRPKWVRRSSAATHC
jgi:hypothetical protein